MAVTKQNFEIFQRSDYALEYTITDEDGNPQDCTGASFEFVLVSLSTSTATLRIDDNDRFEVSGSDKNTVTITVQEEELDITSDVYYHELRLRDVFGNTAPVATGTVTIDVSSTNIF